MNKHTCEQLSVLAPKIEPLDLGSQINIVSVDLETWQDAPCRPEALYLLELFDQHDVKATFFVSGSVLRQDPQLLTVIDRQGHELASHGFQHKPISAVTQDEFQKDILTSVNLISDIVGKPVIGFRAPIFSISPKNHWAFDCLINAGIKYDSSIFPFKGPRYGVPDFPRHPVRITRNAGSIIEVPLSTVRIMKSNLPVSGGGYFRLLPYGLIGLSVKSVNDDLIPFVIYCHPYEFSTYRLRYTVGKNSIPKLKRITSEIKTNLFRTSMRRKISQLLETFKFTSFKEALGNELQK